MNNQQFYNSFIFRKFSFTVNRHTDNYSNGGVPTNFIGQLIHGHARFVSDNTSVELSEGQLVFIPKGCRYHSYWYTDPNSQLQWYSIGFHWFPTADDSSFLLQKIFPSQQALQLLKTITDDLQKSTQNIGSLYCFLAEISPDLQIDTDPSGQLLQYAIRYMRSNTDARIGQVAAYCNVSESTLYGAFQKNLGITPNVMRQKLLCEKAQELLTTTSLSVEDISSHLGFSSSSYFRKILYKHTGKTPLQLRKDNSL